jgi:hypothetical protein
VTILYRYSVEVPTHFIGEPTFLKKTMGLFKKKDNSPKIGDIIICIDDREWNGTTSIELIHGQGYKLLWYML